MEEQKTEIVEKRVKSTIIRRRRKQVKEEAPKEEKKVVKAKVSVDELTPEKPAVKKKTPINRVLKKAGETEDRPKGLKQVKRTIDLKKRKTVEDVEAQKKEKSKPKRLILQGSGIRKAELGQKAKGLEDGSIEKKLEEKRRQEREKQAQSESQSQEKTVEAKTEDGDEPKTLRKEPRYIKLPEDTSKDDAEKKKIKKGAKKKSKMEIDVDGLGAVRTMTQLTRVAQADRVERVFEPGRGGRRKKVVSKKGHQKTKITVAKASKRVVDFTGAITVGDLAKGMDVKAGEVIKKLMDMGQMATVNQTLDFDTASLVAQEFSFEVKDVAFKEAEVFEDLDKNVDKDLQSRPPVVTVMGHVDHGKTSLLDAIRSANVASGEAGGITQHIGAYVVKLDNGEITFLDTPGHEAFTAMRARGAAATDIVILVVAADDGIMPQTVESIDHAKAAGVPIVVAVNKMDKPEADPEKIKSQLSERGLVAEDWGGDTMMYPVSAIKKEGIKELLEGIHLQAEMLELKAPVNVTPKGIVIEAKLDKSRGPVATILVQEGVLKRGDIIVAGEAMGKIRAMMDHLGQQVEEAGPSHAVEIMGIDQVPLASEGFNVVPDEKTGRKVIDNRINAKRAEGAGTQSKVSLEDFFAKAQAEDIKKLAIVIKTDVQGSLEAVNDALTKLSTEKVEVNVIHKAVGGINESDVLLASASNAIIIGFNVRPETKAIGVAKNEGVDIKLYKVIYDMVNDVKQAMRGVLSPEKKENYLGRAEVRDTFAVSKVGTIAGCYVIDGKMSRNGHLRLLRDNVVIFEGEVLSLKRFKDDAKEVASGFECGLGIKGYSDIKTGDVIECFEVEYFQPEI